MKNQEIQCLLQSQLPKPSKSFNRQITGFALIRIGSFLSPAFSPIAFCRANFELTSHRAFAKVALPCCKTVYGLARHFNFKCEFKPFSSSIYVGINLLAAPSTIPNPTLDTKAEDENKLAPLHERFSRFASIQPDALAIASSRKSLTYAELDRASNALAHTLILKGLEPSDIVPVLLPRSVELAVAILAILKAGGAYAVVGRNWNEERVRETLATLKAKIVVGYSQDTLAFDFLVVPVDLSSEKGLLGLGTGGWEQARTCDSDAPACVFFTSGTTGHAKGVVVPHKAIGRLFAEGSILPFSSKTIIPIAANPSWDAFALEFWGPLLTGGTGVMVEEKFLSPDVIRQKVREAGINSIWLTSSLFNLVVDEDLEAFATLDHVMTGGEKLSVRHVGRFVRAFPDKTLINGYGPVENTVFTTTHKISFRDVLRKTIPIGRPVPQTEIFVLQGDKKCAVDEVGEICTSGSGLAQGYIGAPEHAQNRFTKIELNAGQETPIYRTGDFGYLDAEGTLHFVGRGDRQIKIRGLRVDTAQLEKEIELQAKEISRCRVVAVRNESETVELVAFFLPTQPDKNAEIDIEYLKQVLPDGICPGKFVPLATFPYTDNGKLDEEALLAQLTQPQNDERARKKFSQNGSDLSMQVQAIFDDVAGHPSDNLQQNLFERGGTSLDAARIAARLSRAIGATVEVSEVFTFPSPRTLAEHLGQRGLTLMAPYARTFREPRSDLSLSPVQIDFLIRHLVNPDDPSSHCAMIWKLPKGLPIERLRSALQKIHDSQPALSAEFRLDPRPTMTCSASGVFEFHHVDAGDNVQSTISRVEELLYRPLDPPSGRLWHAAYADLPNESAAILGIAVHHIAFDGASEQILAETLANLLCDDTFFDEALPRAELQHIPAPTSMQNPEKCALLARISPLDWPIKTCLEDMASVSHETMELDRTLTDNAQVMAGHLRTPQIAVFLSAWAQALLQVTMQDSVTVGVPVNRRAPEHADHLVGCFVGMAPVILKLLGNQTHDDHIRASYEAFQTAQELVPLMQIPPVSWIQKHRSKRHFPYQNILTLHEETSRDFEMDGRTAHFFRPAPRRPVCDLSLDLWRHPSRTWKACLAFDPEMLDRATARNIFDKFTSNLTHLSQMVQK